MEQHENDDVLEFNFTGTDQAGNLADMAETLSQDEVATAILIRYASSNSYLGSKKIKRRKNKKVLSVLILFTE